MRRFWFASIVLLASLAAVSAPAGAQAPLSVRPVAPPRTKAMIGGDFAISQPVGEFDANIGAGYGASGSFVWNLDRRGIFGIRSQLGWEWFGSRKRRVTINGPGYSLRADLTTSNNLVFGGIGPQITAPSGAIRPYAAATGGFSYFYTQTSARSVFTEDEFDTRTEVSDAVWAWSGVGGVLIPINSRRNSSGIMIDLGLRYHGNGEVEYVSKGGIVQRPDGTVEVNSVRTQANLLTYHVGIQVPIR